MYNVTITDLTEFTFKSSFNIFYIVASLVPYMSVRKNESRCQKSKNCFLIGHQI